MNIFVEYKLTSLLRDIKRTRYLKWRGSPTPSGKLSSQSHLKLSRYTQDIYTVVKRVGPGVTNLALNIRATTYQPYDPIQTTEPLQISVSLFANGMTDIVRFHRPGTKIRRNNTQPSLTGGLVNTISFSMMIIKEVVSFLFRTSDTFDLQVQEVGSTLKLYCPQRRECPGEQERAVAQSRRASRCPNMRGCRRRQCLSVSSAASLEGAGPPKRCSKHKWGCIPTLCGIQTWRKGLRKCLGASLWSPAGALACTFVS